MISRWIHPLDISSSPSAPPPVYTACSYCSTSPKSGTLSLEKVSSYSSGPPRKGSSPTKNAGACARRHTHRRSAPRHRQSRQRRPHVEPRARRAGAVSATKTAAGHRSTIALAPTSTSRHAYAHVGCATACIRRPAPQCGTRPIHGPCNTCCITTCRKLEQGVRS